MKKILSLIMVLAIILSLTACGKQSKYDEANALFMAESYEEALAIFQELGDYKDSLAKCEEAKEFVKLKEAFEASKSAYTDIDKAYEITEQFGSDVYEAWMLGIHEKDEILSDGVSYLATELSLTEEELTDGIAHWWATKIDDEDWDTLDWTVQNKYRADSDILFSVFEDDLFSFCIDVVTEAYLLNGKTAEAQEALDAAKEKMKELSATYSDYEHYPNLKGYFTTTSSFFDFCQAPTGTFEQVKTTINDYKNEARDYRSDLDYIFEV